MHETHMQHCLSLGRAALKAGEIPVGALVLRGDVVLGEGQEGVRALLDLSAHAEVQAIRAACRTLGSFDLSGCTLYTTVEPCVLCAYVVRRAGVSRVVYGVPVGQAGGLTSRYDILADSALAGWPAPPESLRGSSMKSAGLCCRSVPARPELAASQPPRPIFRLGDFSMQADP